MSIADPHGRDASRGHEMRNQLAVAVANVEAFRDGLLEPTPERLAIVLDALAHVEKLLREIP